MSEELRHRFNRLTFYTLLLAFLSVSMTFVIFSTVAQPTLTCDMVSYVTSIGTSTDACSRDIQQFQQGTTSCNIVNPAHDCTGAITFPTQFASTPNFIAVQWTGWDTLLSHPEEAIPVSTLQIESDNGTTWHNMPAAKTELYGTNTREATLQTNLFTYTASGHGLGSFQTSVTCVSGTTGGSELLRTEYQDNAGGWHDLASVPGFADLSLGPDCPSGFPGSIPVSSAIAGIIPAFTVNGTGLVRIVGMNGIGAGDNPILNNIFLNIYIVTEQTATTCVFQASQLCGFTGPGPAPTKTGFSFAVIVSNAVFGTNKAFISWTAYLCVKGGASC